MKANEIKTNIIADLQLIVDMAIEQAEVNNCSFESYMEVRKPKTPAMYDKFLFDFIDRSPNCDTFNDQWKFEYGKFWFKCNIYTIVYMGLIQKIKNLYECPKQASTKTGHITNFNSKAYQAEIDYLRRLYQSDKEYYRKAVKLSKNKDLIDLCQKYITDPILTEGINLPYTEQPKAIFTPYKEVKSIPEYIQIQYKIAI